MELGVGVVAGFWTPVAAKPAAWVISQMTPQGVEELFARLGHMTPAKTSLDRLPKQLAHRWDEDRPGYEGSELRRLLRADPGRLRVRALVVLTHRSSDVDRFGRGLQS
jgi:hypothetical protein